MCVLGPGSPGSSSEEYSLEVSVSMFSRRVVMGAASWACSSGSGSGFGSSSLVMANPTEAKVSDCGTRCIGALAERTTLNPFSFSPRARPSFCLTHDFALLTGPVRSPGSVPSHLCGWTDNAGPRTVVEVHLSHRVVRNSAAAGATYGYCRVRISVTVLCARSGSSPLALFIPVVFLRLLLQKGVCRY
jgi:hypothetical protein